MSDPAELFSFGVPATGSALLSQEIRDSLEAVARCFYSTDPDFPAGPRDGMPRVLDDASLAVRNVKMQFFIDSAWQTVLQNLQAGTASPVKQVASFSVAAVSWIVDHNFGTKPLVQAVNSAGIVLEVVAGIPAVGQCNIEHVSENRVVVTHPVATSGSVVLIG